MTFEEWAEDHEIGQGFWIVAREIWNASTAAAIERCAEACSAVGAERVIAGNMEYLDGRAMAVHRCELAIRALQEPRS